MKKILSVITSAVLCFSAAAMPCVSAAQLSTPAGVVSENKTDASGTCGTNVSWTLSGGTLTISGSGKMVEWQTTKYVPWNDHMSEIRSVVIGSGVTNVGRGAFYKASNLSSVTIPSTVTEISASAFRGSGIQSITIPSSVTSIGVDCFRDCGQLREIKIYNSNCMINGGTNTVSASATIYAPSGSLAQQYCTDFNHNFSVLNGSEPTQPTQPTTTTTRATTTTTSRTTTSRTTTTTTSRTTTATTTVTTTSEVTQPIQTWTAMPECTFVGVASYPTKTVYTEGEELSFDGLALTLNTRTFYQSIENSWWVTGDEFRYEFRPGNNIVTITSSDGRTYGGDEFSNLPAGKYNVRVKGYGGQVRTPDVFANLNNVDFAYDVTINAKETTTTTTVTTTTTTTVPVTTYSLRIDVASMPNKTVYNVGEAFSANGLRISSYITRGDQAEVLESDSIDPMAFPGSFDISTPDMSTPGTKTVTVEMHRYNPDISDTVRAYTSFNITVGDSQQYNDKLGDANLDGIVDGRDATLILTEYVKSSTNGGAAFASSPGAKAVADVDGNGIIDGRDATSILTYYAYISVDGNPQIDLKSWYDSNNR